MFRPVSSNEPTAVMTLPTRLAPLDILSGGSYLRVFSDQQLHSLSLLFLNLSLDAGHVALVFFGVFHSSSSAT